MKKVSKTKTSTYIIEAAVAIAFIYFVLGGSSWSPAIWAIFAVIAIWIIVMNVRHDDEKETTSSYEHWKLSLAFIMVLGLLGGAIWQRSILLLVFGLLLGAIWFGDLRAYRKTYSSPDHLSDSEDSD
ncbi:MAG: hypothetical protein ACUZ8N_12585 [Candidatus Scalindua sp.]